MPKQTQIWLKYAQHGNYTWPPENNALSNLAKNLSLWLKLGSCLVQICLNFACRTGSLMPGPRGTKQDSWTTAANQTARLKSGLWTETPGWGCLLCKTSQKVSSAVLCTLESRKQTLVWLQYNMYLQGRSWISTIIWNVLATEKLCVNAEHPTAAVFWGSGQR